ncbi:MAG TPA: cytochrome c-type biogenesis protein CcmH [Terriglobales bacterium]|nr:cytochrome c-type biogenesis protein CcmH [Terriglobales bacterium]
MPARSFHIRQVLQVTALLLAAFGLLGAGDQQARFDKLGHKLMCECGCNQVLLECNHVGCPLSDRMRGELAANVQRADSDDLVLQAFVQKYGPTVLLAPTDKGFNRVAWIIPYLTLVLGLGAVALIVRSWRGRPLLPPEGAVAPVSGAELERFRQQARKETGI